MPSADDIQRDIKRMMVSRMTRACGYLADRIKENLSVPAPRVKTRYGYRATTRATPGAFPRKLSGELRRATAYIVTETNDAVVGRVGNSKIYARPLELKMGHAFVSRTFREEQDNIMKILATGRL